jgi:hypothetical protein
VSRITPYKWLAVLPIFVAILLYHYAYMAWVIPGRWDPWGIPLGRVVLYGDVNYNVLLGGWLNIVGILFLFTGLIREVRTRNGKIFVLSGSGAILGWVLFWGSVVVFYNILSSPIEIPEEIVRWVGMPGFPIIGGLIAFNLARKHTKRNGQPSGV